MKYTHITAKDAAEMMLDGEPVYLIKKMEPTRTFVEELKTQEAWLYAGKEEDAEEAAAEPKRKTMLVDKGKVMALRQAGWTQKKIADEMGCSVTTINKILNKKEDPNVEEFEEEDDD